MLPGQVGLLLIGIISALALCVLGAFSYLAFSKEKKQKAREARARRREQWHESLKATADDDLLESFAREDAAQAEQVPAEGSAEADVAEAEEPMEEPRAFDFYESVSERETTPPAEVSPAPIRPTPAPKPKNTRNDFDFKF